LSHARRDPLADRLLRGVSLATLCCAVGLLTLIVGFIAWESRIPPATGMSVTDFLLFERWDPSGQRCWDLDKALGARGAPVRYALSAEKDRYVKHHRTFGGTAYVWLNAADDLPGIRERILRLDGIENVMTRDEAAAEFGLMPERIGELVVTGDKDTVFGELKGEYEELESTYRSHGSLHESDVPMIIYNYQAALPAPEFFRRNADVAHFLFR
jgi:phosphonoacetate hydrolase